MEKKEESLMSFSADDNTSKDEPAELQELLQTLPQQMGWDGQKLLNFNGFWARKDMLIPLLASQKRFRAENTDTILASLPKSGTTWLKALTFSIATRHIFPIHKSPLLTSNPHKFVPFVEYGHYLEQAAGNNPDCLTIPPGPRILSTHMSFGILPDSILESDCKIIYICRNPLDMFISYRSFLITNGFLKDAETELAEAFELFCRGVFPCGPYWDHVLGYWNAHQENPNRVLFLRYEDLQENIEINLKKIGEFVGLPFSGEEEKRGLVEEISNLCSFESLRSLKVNKTGSGCLEDVSLTFKNSSFFRKGEVGDYNNYLTAAMIERMKKIVESKFKDSGLLFTI